MPTFTESIQIRADRKVVWSVIVDPAKVPHWYEGMETYDADYQQVQVGGTAKWTYRTMGLEFKGTTKMLEVTPGAFLRCELDGLIKGIQEFKLSEAAGGTLLEVTTDYHMSGGVLGKLAEPVVHQMNLNNAKKSVANIKQMAEAG